MTKVVRTLRDGTNDMQKMPRQSWEKSACCHSLFCCCHGVHHGSD